MFHIHSPATVNTSGVCVNSEFQPACQAATRSLTSHLTLSFVDSRFASRKASRPAPTISWTGDFHKVIVAGIMLGKEVCMFLSHAQIKDSWPGSASWPQLTSWIMFGKWGAPWAPEPCETVWICKLICNLPDRVWTNFYCVSTSKLENAPVESWRLRPRVENILIIFLF